MQKKNIGSAAPRLKPALANGPIPVTMLSGFLGSGKTTLLEHILKNKEGLRCAVVVNDMAEINIDASLVKGTKLLQTKEQIVELHNGCICCTLRQDLLLALREMALSGNFDVIVIESTGISEPMQVAETFFIDQEDGHGVLNNIARLDNCVTVVDASTFYDNLKTLDNVTDKYGKESGAQPCVPPTVSNIRNNAGLENGECDDENDNCQEESDAANNGEEQHHGDDDDDRNISHLLIDQVEFANVILLNKMDLVPSQRVNETLALLRTLNPVAKIVCTTNSNVDVRDVLFTERFTETFAQQAKGWMAEVNSNSTHNPETLEYGIGSFVYRSDRAFHPGRLGSFITKYFMLQEIESEEAQPAEEATVIAGSSSSAAAAATTTQQQQQLDDADAAKAESRQKAVERAAARRTDLGNLFRSKGYIWIGAPARLGSFGEWNHAGNILSFTCGGGWGMFPDLPGGDNASASAAASSTESHSVPLAQRAAEFAAKAAAAAKKADLEAKKMSANAEEAVVTAMTTFFAEKTPCQEIVMIGQDLKKDVIAALLDECLLTKEEEHLLTQVMINTPPEEMENVKLFEDPFEHWNLDDDEDDEWEDA